MSARLSNLGYMAVGKETTKGVAVTPSFYVPLYDESFVTNINIDKDNPIFGIKSEIFQALQGQRTHKGSFTVLGEPNTAGHLINMMLTKGNTSGSDPYTHPFTVSSSTDPKSYTIDIQKGQIVHRFIGCELSELSSDFDKNKMVLKGNVSALKSFIVREISSVTGSGPYTITFKTNYDPSPSTGLVVGDVISVYKSNGTIISAVVDSVPGGTTITCSEDVSTASSGDMVFLAAATPSYNLKTPFMWTRTEFRFGADASTALSATHTPLEEGSKWTLMHKFEKEEGAMRSGSFDPASLNRTQTGGELVAKIFFDTPEDLNRFMTVTKRACVVRHFSEGSTYELRVTFNNLRFEEMPVNLKSGEIVYAEGKYVAVYDTSDGAQLSVSVLNALSSI